MQVHSTKAIIGAVAKPGGISIVLPNSRAPAGTASCSLTRIVALWRSPGLRSSRVTPCPSGSALVLQDRQPVIDIGQIHQPVRRDIDIVRLHDARTVRPRIDHL